MAKVRCSHCGHITKFEEGQETVFCERCGFEMRIHYEVEKIEGDPVSFLLKRAELGDKTTK